VDEILQTIDRQFRLRSCDQPIVYDENNRPCFYYQIERCGSPCSGKMTKTEYERELERVRFFLGGFSDGIITQLIRKMNEFADAEQFELADSLKHQITELRRLFARRENVPTSVNQNNVVVVIPGGGREKTADVFLIRHGKLAHFETLGIKQPLDQFAETLGHTYFNGNTAPLRFTPEDIDEIRIVNSWIYKYNTSGSFIYVEGKSPKALLSEFRQALRGEQPEE
ncbi:MAG: UvrB/UvrC motif-containing protein, partial [Bacteroidota bacterium]